MGSKWMVTGAMLLAAAQAQAPGSTNLLPASTFPLYRSPRFTEVRAPFTPLRPPVHGRNYEETNNVKFFRGLGCGSDWTSDGANCYKHFPASLSSNNGGDPNGKGWTWEQAKRHCSRQAYESGNPYAELAFPETAVDNQFVQELVDTADEDAWLGAKFIEGILRKKKAIGTKPEEWEEYTGWAQWEERTPIAGFSRDKKLLIEKTGKWKVWNGKELKGFVCKYQKKVCKTDWKIDEDNDKCIKIFNETLTWANAERRCQQEGHNGHLASLASQEKVLELAKSDQINGDPIIDFAWLGGSVTYGSDGSGTPALTFTWTDGDNNVVSERDDHWAQGYKDLTSWIGETHIFINHDGKVGVEYGNEKTNFICQYDVPTTSLDTLWQLGNFGR